jgi:FKBP-type peptidyl-prolyl cis-trans isomerase SlyD
MTSIAVGPDTLVTLSYVLFDERGEAVDRAPPEEPLQYVHGYAQIVPGLESAIEGMHAGEKRSVVIEAQDAFGERDEAGVFGVDKEDFPNSSEIVPGDEFLAQSPEGEPMTMRIVEVLEDSFVVDTNHPLAGQRVRFEVEVSEVREASDEEIAEAQAELEDQLDQDHACCDHDHGDGKAHDHDHGHDHGHDHDHGGERLVQLAKKA